MKFNVLTLITALFVSTNAAAASPTLASIEDAVRIGESQSKYVDDALRTIADNRVMVIWAQTLLDVIRQVPWVDLRTIETKLRRLNIDVYLTARPANQTPQYCAHLPFDAPGECRPYSLWIGVGGRAEAEAQRAAWGATEQQNLERLAQAGFQYVRPKASPTP